MAQALRVPGAEVRTVACERIAYHVTNPSSAGLYRWRGDAVAGGVTHAWSLVLKLVQPWPDEAVARWAPADAARFRETNAWDREVDAYASGRLETLAPGLVAPRLLGLERAADGAALWLEDVREDTPAWSVGRYALAARQLGAFNARFAGSDPGWPWLSHGALRTWTERTSAPSRAILDDDAPWEHPAVRAALGDDARPVLQRVVARHAALLALLDGLPHCVAHLDAYRGNLLARGDETVALDWSFVGVGPVGAEASQLVCASAFYSHDPVDVDALSDAVLSSYLDALRDGGWRGSADDVRRAFLASTLVRWATIGLGAIRAAGDAAGRTAVEERVRIGYDAWLAAAGRRIAYLRRCEAALEAMGPR